MSFETSTSPWLTMVVLLIILICGHSTREVYWRNVAVGKPSIMSTSNTWQGKLADAELANDGNFNPAFSSFSCSESQDQHAPWWMVDLKLRYLISGIRLTSRDRNPERLSNFTLELSEFSTGFGNLVGASLCRYEPGGPGASATVFYPCSTNTVARYMKLTVHNYNTGVKMCVCEVEVMATDYEMHYQMRGLKGQRSKNALLETVTTSGVIMCQAHCLRLERCTSFNAIQTEPRKVFCEMISDPSPWLQDRDVMEQGWTHYVPSLQL